MFPIVQTFASKLSKRFLVHVHEIVIAVAVDVEKWHLAGILALAGAVLIFLAVQVFLKIGEA